ncbi:MAG TPA: thiamine phosphate synthase [Acidobacteriaceae bacterium]|jgi:thiamine-phosphate pyrophosphorylase|nr:thiamine phosphate synthase [Acidobacteriaceae bacterium]
MLLYAITSRRLLPGDESARRDALVELARGWARGGVDLIQVREKDLPLTELQGLARRIVEAVRGEDGGKGMPGTRVLVNGPAQVALDAGADGVHLHAGMGANAVLAAQQAYARVGKEPMVSAACHSPEEIREANGATEMLFSPVFEKVTGANHLRGQGLAALRAAVELAKPTPVLALGGVTEKNVAACLQAGAAGVAAIRLFMGDAWRGLIADGDGRTSSSAVIE